MATQHEEIAARIGLDSTPFARGVRSVEQTMKNVGNSITNHFNKIGGAIAGIFATQKVISFGQSILRFADELKSSSERLGASVEFLQGFRHAATQSGVAADTASQALEKLSIKVGEAAAGGKQASEAFVKLGISIFGQDGRIKSTDKLFLEIAERIKAIPDPALRSAAAFDIFGKSGAKLVPLLVQGKKGFEELSGQIKKLSEEDIAKLDDIGDKLEALGTRLKVGGGSFILSLSAGLKGNLEEARKHARDFNAEILKLIGLDKAAAAVGNKAVAKAAAAVTPAVTPPAADPRAKEFAEFQAQLKTLDAEARNRAGEINRTLFSNPRNPDKETLKVQTEALKSVDEQIAELLRKASEEGLIIQPRNGK